MRKFMNKDYENKFSCNIKNYISDEYSICREERQYALFLYNILRKHTTNNDKVVDIFKACNIPNTAQIKYVFYEATFMRDFFERNRRMVLGNYNSDKYLNKTFTPQSYEFKEENTAKSFNNMLIDYIKTKDSNCEDFYSGIELNMGGKNVDCYTTIKSMMNSKPDIAVIYKDFDRKQYLLFLECKFESDEGSDGKKQRKIQYLIADFLCDKYLTNLKVSPKMKEDNEEKSCLVQFVRKDPQNDNEISIKTLIDLNEEIFSSK